MKYAGRFDVLRRIMAELKFSSLQSDLISLGDITACAKGIRGAKWA